MRVLSWLAAAALILAPVGATAAEKAGDVPTVTPIGITVFALGDVRGKDGVLRIGNNRRPDEVYTDHRGFTLYTSNKDIAGVHAIYNFTPKSYYGVDDRSLVVVKLVAGKWVYQP